MAVGPHSRINGSMVRDHVGKPVVLLGHAKDVDPNGLSFTLTCADGQSVKVIMTQPLNEYVSGLTEVHGTVDQRQQISCTSYVLFSNEASQNFDAGLYTKTVEVIHQFTDHYIVGVDHE